MKEKIILTLAVIADLVIFGVLIFNVYTLRKEINFIRNKYSDLETKMEYLEKDYYDVKAKQDELEKNTSSNINAEPISEDFWKEYDKQVDGLDKTIFVTDFKNYKPKDTDMNLTKKEISEIAENGFKESAARIAGEGAENKASEKIEELDEIIPNNYFTRKYREPDEIYKDLKTHGYKVTRTNDMGNGIYIYIDKTTGLIIGGGAFGD